MFDHLSHAEAEIASRKRVEDGRIAEADLWVRAAGAAQAEGRGDDARRDLRRALRRNPDSVVVFTFITHCFARNDGRRSAKARTRPASPAG